MVAAVTIYDGVSEDNLSEKITHKEKEIID
jgi:hypothetical protein